MSYANQQTTWLQKQSSIGGAFIINGLLVAGLMLTNHVVQPKPKEGGTTVIDIPLAEKPEFIEPDITPALPPIAVPKPPISPPAKNDRYISEIIERPVSTVAAGTASGEDIISDFPVPIEPVIEPIIEPVIPDPIFIKAQKDPKYADRFQPIYPGTLLRQEIEGTVRLRFLIGVDGRVKSVNILSASHPKFAAAAEKQALRKWRFIPATRDGRAVEQWQTITVSFNLN